MTDVSVRRLIAVLLDYPCTLNVRPLAVFLSFSSFSGLARLRTILVSVIIMIFMGKEGIAHLGENLLFSFAFVNGYMPDKEYDGQR